MFDDYAEYIEKRWGFLGVGIAFFCSIFAISTIIFAWGLSVVFFGWPIIIPFSVIGYMYGQWRKSLKVKKNE